MQQEYGSVQNLLLSHSKPLVPAVGMPCTEICWTDRHPWKVVEVTKNRAGEVTSAVVQSMSVKADESKTPAMGHQDWIITDNPNGRKVTIKFRKSRNGWFSKFERTWGNCFALGYAEEHYDWSF